MSRHPAEVDRSPARFSATGALLAAAVAVGATALASLPAAALGGLGTLLVAGGVVFGARRAVTLGAVGLFGGAAVAGIFGAAPGPTLVAATAAVVAWDLGGNAVSVGEQLGREAPTRRGELAHAAAGTAVAAATAGFGYVLYRLAAGGQPVGALVFLLVGAVVIASALRV